MKALQKINGFVSISSGMQSLICLFISAWYLLKRPSSLVFNFGISVGEFFSTMFSGNYIRRVFFLIVFFSVVAFHANAQRQYFRVLGGIPHLPVFTDEAQANSVIGTPEAGMLIYSEADLAPLLNVGGAWVNLCLEKQWTGGVDYFKIEKGIPFIPLKASTSGTIPSGAVFFSSVENSVMVADDGRSFRKITLLNAGTSSFSNNPGFEALGGEEKLFRLPIFTTLPTAGVEQGAICIDASSKSIHFYDSGWNRLNCGFVCGGSITVNHLTTNLVAPENKTLLYGTVTEIPGEPTKCWTTKNLGADEQAMSVDASSNKLLAAGWYWQFNRKQGYKHDGATRTPSTTWIDPIVENTNWQDINDPCVLELQEGWRLPTYTEWYNVITTNSWNVMDDAWNSDLKLHAAGFLHETYGTIQERGRQGLFASSSIDSDDTGYLLDMSSTYILLSSRFKSYGSSVRCIRDPNYSALAPAQPGPIYNGPDVICTNTCYTYKINAVAGATSYEWSFSGLGEWNVSTDGLSCTLCPTSLGNYGGGVLSVVAKNAYGSSNPISFSIDISVYTITYGTYICRTGIDGQVKNVSYNYNGQWTGAGGGTFIAKNTNGIPTTDLVVDPDTGQIDVYASKAGGYYVCFDADNGCSSCCRVTICDTPVSPYIEYPETHVCQYPNTLLHPSVVTPSNQNPDPFSGGTYYGGFSSDDGLVIDYTTGAINVGASEVGTHIITYTPNPLCCPDVKVTTVIRIDALPTGDFAILREPTCDNPTADISLSFDVHPPYPAPTAPSPQLFYPPDHNGYYVRIYDLSVTSLCGYVQWWDAPYGGNQLDTYTDLVNGRTYYASQCYSDERVAITVYLVDYSVPAPTPAAPPVYPPTNPISWTIYNATGSVVTSGGGSITGTGTYAVEGLEPGTYTCIATNEETGCNSQAITITILPPPDDCLLYTIIPDCVSGKTDVQICLTDLVTDLNNLTGWTLDVDGPTSSTGNSFTSACITIQDLDPGNYKFIAKNGTITSQISVTIDPICCPPDINVTAIDCTTKEGSVVICVNNYETNGSCDWNLTWTDPDGNTESDKNITDRCVSKYNLGPGTYTVVVENNKASCPPVTTTVTLNCPDNCRPEPIDYTLVRETTCDRKTADITITGLPSTGNWTLTPGDIGGTGTSTQIKDLPPGTYSYVVTDESGCFSDTLTVNILCPDGCTAEVPPYRVMRQPDCDNKTADVVFELPDGVWTVNPGKNVTSNALYPIYGLAPGTYYYTFTNAEGCVSDTVTVTIQCPTGCFDKVVAEIIREPICENKTADVRISGMPSGDWIINPGGYTGNGTEEIIYNVPVGTYTFTVTDQFGCIQDKAIVITIDCPPNCHAGCEVPIFRTTVPDCKTKTFDLHIENLPTGKWDLYPGNYSGNGGTLDIYGLTPGVQYVYTLVDEDQYTATYVVFVEPPCCPVTVTVLCVPAGHDLEKIWTDHSEVIISGLPEGGCTLTQLSPTQKSPISVSGTTHTFYSLPNGTYKYRMTNQWGCEFDITFVVDCHFISWKILREPVCGGSTTADIEFSNLPADGWKIVPGQAGGAPTGTQPIFGEGTTKVLTNIAQGDYTYEIYNLHEELLTNLSVTVPYPGDGTVPSVQLLNQDCAGKKTASIYVDHLPFVWTIYIGSLIEQTGEGAFKQFDNVPMGTYSVSVLNHSTGCISDPVSVRICE